MPRKDRPQVSPDTDEVVVRLRSVLGVRPGVYLTVLYGLALALLVFFLLFYPGLHRRGIYLSLSTFPDKATVKVDGAYAGSTPCTIFLKRGERSIVVSKPFYQPVAFTQKVRGRVFGTLFVPDRRAESRRITVEDLPGLLSHALNDFQKNAEIPEIISDAAFAAASATDRTPLYDFVGKSMLSLTPLNGETQLKRLVLAEARVASAGGFLTQGSLVQMVQQVVQLEERYDNFPAWLLLILGSDTRTKLVSDAWVQGYRQAFQKALSSYYGAGLQASGPSARRISLLGSVFHEIPAGTLVMGKDDDPANLGNSIDLLLPHPVSVGSFYLQEAPVSNSQFALFTAANPEWAPAARAALVSRGLATDSYLSAWVDGKPATGTESLPVTNVSWSAAEAFCQWLTPRVQSVLPGYVARLPYESEWEWAARGGLRGQPFPTGARPGAAVFYQKGANGPSRAGTSDANGYGLRDMAGNVWEWSADPFNLTANLLSSLDPRAGAILERQLPDAPERVVRGGSWSSQRDQVRVYTRGSQPADWCTPYLGFRVALARD